MKKLLLIILIFGLGILAFATLRRSALQTQAATAAQTDEFNALARRFAEEQKTNAALHSELVAKKNHLRLITRHPEITPELIKLIESEFAKGSPDAWAQLRQLLGLGWNSSPDYVLVHKETLKGVEFQMLYSATTPTDTAMDMLNLSPEERSNLVSALQRIRDGWEGNSLQRTAPHDDVVAQYTLAPPDAASEQSLSNSFATALSAAVGPERADLMQHEAWSNFRNDLGPTETETLTVRQAVVNGEPDLTYQVQRGPNGSDGGSSGPIRYANYPSSWFLSAFPGGWDTLAQREGFQLPPAFHKQQ